MQGKYDSALLRDPNPIEHKMAGSFNSLEMTSNRNELV